jgi:antitoxin ParD1/3/4
MSLNVSLTPQLEKLVKDKVKSGRYLSSSEVIREGLRLLDERDHIRAEKIEALKRDEVAIGIEQADRGEVSAWDPDELMREIKTV